MLGKMHLLSDRDCESAAFEALWDAINCFDVFSKVPFADYACPCIRNAVNDTLRKRQAQKRSLYIAVELTDDINLFYTDEVCSADTYSKVEELFDRYINHHVTGSLARNILLVWHSSVFEMEATEIAKQCHTSPSYVCRVQCAFRAYLGNKLKE
jgi:DNA-directed RNA polymerase specialized sigma subunit